MAYTIPPDTRAQGNTGHIADHDNIVDVLSGMGATYNILNTTFGSGADPTGSADSTTAINAAISALNTAGGGKMVLPPGTFKISGNLTLYNNIEIQGFGRAVTTVHQTSTTAHGFYWTGANLQYVTIRDLSVTGPGSGSGIGINLNNPGVGGNPNILGVHIENVSVTSFGGDGFAAEILIVSQLDNVVVASCGGDGFSLSGGVNTSVVFNSCYANGNTGSGYDLENCTYVTLNGCAADSNNLGYYISNAGGVTLNSCGAESSPYGFKVDGGTCCTLNSCFTYANSNVSFWAADSALNVTFTGCYESAPSGATHSFQFDAGCNVNVIGWQYTTAPLQTAVPNQVNDGSGNFQVAGACYLNGVVNMYGGSSTQYNATASTPTIVSGTAMQPNTTQDVMLYADVKVSSTFSLAIGPTATPATTIMTSATTPVGLQSVRVPAGWYVKSTFTSADVTWTAVTC